jgi:hypothetical protein
MVEGPGAGIGGVFESGGIVGGSFAAGSGMKQRRQMGRALMRLIHRVLVELLSVAVVLVGLGLLWSAREASAERFPGFDPMWLDTVCIIVAFCGFYYWFLLRPIFPTVLTISLNAEGIVVMPLEANNSTVVTWEDMTSARYSRLLGTITLRSKKLGVPYRLIDREKYYKKGDTFDGALKMIKEYMGDRLRERWL